MKIASARPVNRVREERRNSSQVWWFIPRVTPFKMLRQEDCKTHVNADYIVHCRPVLVTKWGCDSRGTM